MHDTVTEIKSRLSITDVIGQYVTLVRAGQNLRAKCPFHTERTPSFFVSPERGTYHCFGCDKGGDIFSFVEEVEGIDFKGALKILAERAGVTLVYSTKEKTDERDRLFALMETVTIFYASRMPESAMSYLQERGLSEASISSFRIGYAGNDWSSASDYLKEKGFSSKEILDAGIGKSNERTMVDKFRNRIMFPIADSAGRIVAFSGRVFGEHAHPDAPKYLNSPETALFKKSKVLYGFNRAKLAIRKHNVAILVEGQMDLLLSHEAGWANTVAASGTAFTEEHAALLKRMTDNLVIALDADEAGIKAASRAARVALNARLRVKVAALPSGGDPADFIKQNGKDAWSGIIRESKDIITFLLDVVEERAKNPEQFRRSVEMAVIPFLHDVLSSIDREHYVREIARRIQVSEQAVNEALTKSKTITIESHTQEKPAKVRQEFSKKILDAYGFLMWQKSVGAAGFDRDSYEQELKDILGKSVFARLDALSDERVEALRFNEERIYGDRDRTRSATDIVRTLTRERLDEEGRELNKKILISERAGDEANTMRLMTQRDAVNRSIAKLEK